MSTSVSDMRRSARVLATSRGRIELLNKRSAYDCTIVDLSNDGARILIENVAMVPNEFQLDIPSKGLSKRATVKWRDVKELGVAFLEVDEHALAVRMLALEEEVRELKARLEELVRSTSFPEAI
jgi:hypothetical protein